MARRASSIACCTIFLDTGVAQLRTYIVLSITIIIQFAAYACQLSWNLPIFYVFERASIEDFWMKSFLLASVETLAFQMMK